MALATMQDLMTEELRDLYSAEMQMLVALPAMAAGADSTVLRDAFLEHLERTHEHVARLEQVFDELNVSTRGAHCPGVAVLLWDAKVAMSQQGDPLVRDAALIVAAQRLENYEIVSYRTAFALATLLALPHVATQLENTLNEEMSFDQRLSGISLEMMQRPAALNSVPSSRLSRFAMLTNRREVANRV